MATTPASNMGVDLSTTVEALEKAGYEMPPVLYPERTKLEKIVESVSYKPGWTLRLRHGLGYGAPGGYWIQWSWRAPDAVMARSTWGSWGSLSVTGTPRYVDPNWDETDIIREIHASLVECEMHELNEFFRYKERIIYDPHRRISQLMPISPERAK